MKNIYWQDPDVDDDIDDAINTLKNIKINIDENVIEALKHFADKSYVFLNMEDGSLTLTTCPSLDGPPDRISESLWHKSFNLFDIAIDVAKRDQNFKGVLNDTEKKYLLDMANALDHLALEFRKIITPQINKK